MNELHPHSCCSQRFGKGDTVCLFCVLEFHVLAPSKVIPIYDNSQSWLFHNATPLRDKATDAMTQKPTHAVPLSQHLAIQSVPYPTGQCCVSTGLGRGKYNLDKSFIWLNRTPYFPYRKPALHRFSHCARLPPAVVFRMCNMYDLFQKWQINWMVFSNLY